MTIDLGSCRIKKKKTHTNYRDITIISKVSL